MDTKVYESTRKVTLKDGTIREYKTRSSYTPKPKRDKFKSEIAILLKSIENKEKLQQIKEFIEKIKNDS